MTKTRNHHIWCTRMSKTCMDGNFTKVACAWFQMEKRQVQIWWEIYVRLYYDEDIDKRYILEVRVKNPKKLHKLQSDLLFLPKRIKIEKCEKLACNMYDNKTYIIHVKALKQARNNGFKVKKKRRVIKFNQEAWLKSYIIMNTKLRTKVKNDFEIDLFNLMDSSALRKTMENVRKHRDVKLVTTDKGRSHLVSEFNCHATKWFSENMQTIEMNKDEQASVFRSANSGNQHHRDVWLLVWLF